MFNQIVHLVVKILIFNYRFGSSVRFATGGIRLGIILLFVGLTLVRGVVGCQGGLTLLV